MYDFHTGNLLATFSSFFISLHVGCVTILASRSSYSLPRIRTNYYKKSISDILAQKYGMIMMMRQKNLNVHSLKRN